jgi:hypothetical protein
MRGEGSAATVNWARTCGQLSPQQSCKSRIRDHNYFSEKQKYVRKVPNCPPVLSSCTMCSHLLDSPKAWSGTRHPFRLVNNDILQSESRMAKMAISEWAGHLSCRGYHFLLYPAGGTYEEAVWQLQIRRLISVVGESPDVIYYRRAAAPD